jgi:hypothetical protein
MRSATPPTRLKKVSGHFLNRIRGRKTIDPGFPLSLPLILNSCKILRPIKKDDEPYQAMGPLSGIFDQRAAEKLNHHADM